jgi:hypothetical protein
LPKSGFPRSWETASQAKDDADFFVSISNSFWQNTEAEFYSLLNTIKNELEQNLESHTSLQQWYKALCIESMRLFDLYVSSGQIAQTDPKCVVLARRELQLFNNSKEIKSLLRIPIELKEEVTT